MLDRKISRRNFLRAGALLGATSVGGIASGLPDMAVSLGRTAPSDVLLPAPNNVLSEGPLHTRGSEILAANGKSVILEGGNWYGFESSEAVAGGLHRRAVDEIAKTIRDDLGFNHVRLPFSVEGVLRNPVLNHGLEANPDLQGLHYLDVMDATVAALADHGVRTILDCHRASAGWTGAPTPDNGLWYDGQFAHQDWLDCWEGLAQRYLNNPAVIGADLFNEPGCAGWMSIVSPTFANGAMWGEGDEDPFQPRDFARASEDCGNRILRSNPNWLIFVEGVRWDPAGPRILGMPFGYWPGGNLTGVMEAGGGRKQAREIKLDVPGRLVYAPHDYGPDIWTCPWTLPSLTALTPNACEQIWDGCWGKIAKEGRAPIWLGEFGTSTGFGRKNYYSSAFYGHHNSQGNWFQFINAYLKKNRLHWFIWAINGNKSSNPLVGSNDRQTESFGLLGPDWKTIANVYVINQLRLTQGVSENSLG